MYLTALSRAHMLITASTCDLLLHSFSIVLLINCNIHVNFETYQRWEDLPGMCRCVSGRCCLSSLGCLVLGYHDIRYDRSPSADEAIRLRGITRSACPFRAETILRLCFKELSSLRNWPQACKSMWQRTNKSPGISLMRTFQDLAATRPGCDSHKKTNPHRE